MAHALVLERVTARFALSLPAFVERLLALPFLADCSGPPFADHVRKLALDDLYLATACAAGDEDAWRELESRHFAFIRDFARRVRTRGSAEDVAAQVIADLWQRRKIAQFEGRSSLRTWLGTVVIRTAINAGGGGRERHVPLDDPAVADFQKRVERDAPTPAGDEDARLLAQLLVRAIERLEDEDKLLLFLYYEERLSLEQIEPALRASKATLSRRLKRIRGRLRDDVLALVRGSTQEESLRALQDGLFRAGSEFDLSAALGDSFRLLQGNRRGRV